jgi:hypothetical protein
LRKIKFKRKRKKKKKYQFNWKGVKIVSKFDWILSISILVLVIPYVLGFELWMVHGVWVFLGIVIATVINATEFRGKKNKSSK